MGSKDNKKVNKVNKVKSVGKNMTAPNKEVKRSLVICNRLMFTPENYDRLVFSQLNRQIYPGQVREMIASVRLFGVLRLVIVAYDEITDKYIIIDGQHLVKALMSLNENIECQVVKCDDNNTISDLIIKLNTTSKNWSIMDFLKTRANSCIEYRFLLNEYERTKLQLSVVLMAYGQQKRTLATKYMKEGTFKIVDRDYGGKLQEQIIECNSFIRSSRTVNECLVQIMLNTKKYSQGKMINALSKCCTKIDTNLSESEIYMQILDIYHSH